MAKVTVYSRNHCPACRMTKKWLTDNAIEFTELDCGKEPKYLTELQLYGYTSLPVVSVGNLDNSWSGYRLDRLRELKEMGGKQHG